MSKRQPEFYYDVTQLIHWGGRLTGIPRVMNEQAIRFRAQQPKTIFISWVKELGQFCEVDLDKTLFERGHGIHYVKAGQDTLSGKPLIDVDDDRDSFKQSQIEIMQQGAIRVVKAILRRSAKIAPRLSAKVERRLKHERLNQYKVAEFGQGDQLFIPWGEWWDGIFIDRLKEWHEKRGLAIIQIIHDMGPVMIPQFSGSGGSGGSVETFPTYCRQILPLASLVLCVSQNTKREVVSWLESQKLSIPRVEVFRLGDDFKVAKAIKPQDGDFEKYDFRKDSFLLIVCTIEARKNHALLYYVYKSAHAQGIDLPKIAIVGRRGWGTDDIYTIMGNDPEVKDKFVFLHNLGDPELSWMYNNCLFTVFPSFYEGWGIPIAESIARGVPCLCSNTTSMVEIAEGYVGHFSPSSPDECLHEIIELLKPENLKAARERTKGYKEYSWDDSFKQVSSYLEVSHE